MITKQELLEYAKVMHTPPWKQEKHYILSLILYTLADYPLIFKGGTYLWLFHGLDRFSEDLDFTTYGELPKDLPKKICVTLKYFGLDADISKIEESSIGLSFRIDIEGPLYTTPHSKTHTYVEISKRENTLKEPLTLTFSNEFYKIPKKPILGMNLEEVSTEKIRTIYKRDKPRDIYDLYYLITEKKVRFNKKLAEEKMKFYQEKLNTSLFAKRIDNLKPDYKKELDYLMSEEAPKFATVKKTIIEWAK